MSGAVRVVEWSGRVGGVVQVVMASGHCTADSSAPAILRAPSESHSLGLSIKIRTSGAPVAPVWNFPGAPPSAPAPRFTGAGAAPAGAPHQFGAKALVHQVVHYWCSTRLCTGAAAFSHPLPPSVPPYQHLRRSQPVGGSGDHVDDDGRDTEICK